MDNFHTAMPQPFLPPPVLRHPFLQTLLASSSLRKLGKNPMLGAESEMILETENDVRLKGHFSPRFRGKGLVILLNGWLGSSDSAYVIATARYLYRGGYSVFRLNYRDHGDSHHLNPGLFYATRLDEVFEGVRRAAFLEKEKPVFLAGFSLGGNFALRIASRCALDGIPNLRHIVSISPALDPEKTTDAIDRRPVIKAYFMKKWRKSLLKKQSLFPAAYDFSEILKHTSIRVVTEKLLKRYSPYKTASQYFNAYSIKPGDLLNIPVPTTLIAAEDDPIIPASDFHRLKLNSMTNLVLHRRGGHNGFLEGFRLNTWYERNMADLFDRITEKPL